MAFVPGQSAALLYNAGFVSCRFGGPRGQFGRVLVSSHKGKKGDWQVDVASIAGSLVHEIKNPLSTLKINAQLLLEDWKDSTSNREARGIRRLRVMIAEVERLERIMQSFLRFTERHELALRPARLNDLLEELADFVTPKARQKGVQVRFWPDPRVPESHFDPDLMRQVFLNLALNAVHVMEEKGGELIFRTRSVERDGTTWVVGDVTDTGPGVPAGLAARIFEPYFSTRKDGTGLGLSTSKRITEEHGGVLELQTAEGRGSQFSVFLPIDPAAGRNESESREAKEQ